MFYRVGSVFLLLLASSLAMAADGWTSAKYGVAIDSFPRGWSIHASDTLVRLEKEFNKDGYGYAYDESMTVAVSLGQNASLESASGEMRDQGYMLLERSRVRFGKGTVPLWIFFQQANQQEVRWIALVLRSGLVYTFEVRGTPLDVSLSADFRGLIAAFHFLPDTRQDAWDAIEAHEPERARTLFQRMVLQQSADGNALYGLGLAELALGQSQEALNHLKLADSIIGLGEARLALGQAYLQTGDPVRATTIWYQLLLDEPDREDELQPYLDDASARARVSDHSLTNERRLLWEDFAFLGAVISIDLQDILTDARSGEFDRDSLAGYEKLDNRCQLLFTEALRHIAVEGGSQVETHYLQAAFDIRQAVQEAIAGLRQSNLEQMEQAEQRLTAGLELLATASPKEEVHP